MRAAQIFPAELETDFQADLAEDKILITRESNALCTVLYLTFGVLDYWALPTSAAHVWAIRGAVAIMNLSMVILSMGRFRGILVSSYSTLTSLQYIVWGLCIEWMIFLSEPGDPARYTYYAGLILVSSALYSWTYLSHQLSIALGASLTLSYLVIAIFTQGMTAQSQWPFLLSNCFFLIGANVIGAYSQNTRDRFARDSFIRKWTLRKDLAVTEEARRLSDYQAEHDPLTGLCNREGLMRRLEAMRSAAKARNEVFGILFIDLDGFKAINDTHGHATGDVVLQIIAHRLRTGFKAVDVRARLGGDEFVLALNIGERSRPEAERILQELVQKVTALVKGVMKVEAVTLQVGSSIGSAIFPFDSDGVPMLLKYADKRMYGIKQVERLQRSG